MYPDWLSLTGKGYVPSIYKRYGKVISRWDAVHSYLHGMKEAV